MTSRVLIKVGSTTRSERTAKWNRLPRLIAAVSAATTLFPGDLILTGSPAGNGGHWRRWLQPGDVMVTAIAGLGTQRNTCVLEDV
jgi:2,4-didehydro-3-deoxy-L-rhamnonate hydrolase